NWAMIAILAKLGTPEMVGQFALGLAIAQPTMLLAQLHLRAVQATDAGHEFQFEDYLALRLLTTLAAVIAIGGIAAFGGFQTQTALVIVVTAFGIGFDAVSDVIYGLLQRHERMDRIAISMILKGSVSLFGLWLGIVVTGRVLGAAVGSAVAS